MHALSLRREISTLRTRLGLFGYGLIRLFHRRLGSLKANSRMGAIAERLIHGAPAATQRKRRLACEVIRITIRIHQFNGSFRCLYSVRPVLANCDFHLRHVSLLLPLGTQQIFTDCNETDDGQTPTAVA